MIQRCCICLETIPKTYPKTSCGHLIHYKCLRQYENQIALQKITCPLCRTQIHIYPKTRSSSLWPDQFRTLYSLLKLLDNEHDYLQRIIISFKIFQAVWDARIIIRHNKRLVKSIREKVETIKWDKVKKFATKKQYSHIKKIADFIYRL